MESRLGPAGFSFATRGGLLNLPAQNFIATHNRVLPRIAFQRASAVLPTQAEAIERARELNPNKAPLVERVRNTDEGSRDKWRKP